MAGTTSKPHRAALKDRPRNFETVIAGLMLPVFDAELADRELAKLEAKAARAAKKKAEDDWHVAWLIQEAASREYEAANLRRLVCSALTGTLSYQQSPEQVPLWAKWVEAIDVLMHLPAPHARALRWKQKYAKVPREWTRAGRAEKPNPRWAKSIAADVARLGKEA